MIFSLIVLFFSLSSTNESIWLVLWTQQTMLRRYVLNIILMPHFTSLQDESVQDQRYFFPLKSFSLYIKIHDVCHLLSWNVIILCFTFSKSIVCCDSKNSVKKIKKRIRMDKIAQVNRMSCNVLIRTSKRNVVLVVNVKK